MAIQCEKGFARENTRAAAFTGWADRLEGVVMPLQNEPQDQQGPSGATFEVRLSVLSALRRAAFLNCLYNWMPCFTKEKDLTDGMPILFLK